MRRMLASVAALVLAATILSPVQAAAAKQSCDEGMAPGWMSTATYPLKAELAEGTHTLSVFYDFIDIDGLEYSGTIDGSFELSWSAGFYPGTVEITPWGLSARSAAGDRYWIPTIRPNQQAAFTLGWGNYQEDPVSGVPLSRQRFTEVIRGITQTVSWDGGPAMPMHFGAVVQECIWLP